MTNFEVEARREQAHADERHGLVASPPTEAPAPARAFENDADMLPVMMDELLEKLGVR